MGKGAPVKEEDSGMGTFPPVMSWEVPFHQEGFSSFLHDAHLSFSCLRGVLGGDR